MKNKRLWTVPVVLVLAFSLSACGGKSSPIDTPASAVSSAEQKALAAKLAEDAQKVPEPVIKKEGSGDAGTDAKADSGVNAGDAGAGSSTAAGIDTNAAGSTGKNSGTGAGTAAAANKDTGTTASTDAEKPQSIVAAIDTSPERLIGEWSDVSNPGRYARISKEGDSYKYQDNDGTYPGKIADGVLVIRISDDQNDTAKVFIDPATGNLVTNYQGDIYQFSRKLKQ